MDQNQVLVVDDNPSDLILTSSFVESEGLEAIKAADGIEALDLLTRPKVS